VGDRSESFEAFFAEQYESVFRGLSVAFRDPLLAEEAAQEAFTRAYVRWEHVHGMERPAGWVYVVAVRVVLRKRRPPRDETARSRSGAQSMEDEVVDRLTMQRAISDLPERQRLALVLRHYGDLPLDEIATAMGCALGTVKSTLHAAHARLHVELDADEIPEVELDAP
jgi:RNA polymerase sigma-70 factor (ECF subfamily)